MAQRGTGNKVQGICSPDIQYLNEKKIPQRVYV